jgi:phosphate transport system substrate-binding protein
VREKSLIQGVVDFGASDAAMTDEEIKKVAAGAVTGSGNGRRTCLGLQSPRRERSQADARSDGWHLTSETVTKWNDPAIVKTES